MPRIIASLLIFAAFVVAPLTSSAVPITVPSDLSVGDKYRLAFVTSTKRDATSTDIADYNAFVTAVAAGVPELAALGTTWKAIGSTLTVDARDNTATVPNVSPDYPIYRLDNTRIADDNANLWGADILAPIATVETGLLNTFDVTIIEVWTGTRWDGMAAPEPLGDPFVTRIGLQFFIGTDWIFSHDVDLSDSLKQMYALSGELTVIPEPSTMILVCIGATAVVGWQLRRRRHRRA